LSEVYDDSPLDFSYTIIDDIHVIRLWKLERRENTFVKKRVATLRLRGDVRQIVSVGEPPELALKKELNEK